MSDEFTVRFESPAHYDKFWERLSKSKLSRSCNDSMIEMKDPGIPSNWTFDTRIIKFNFPDIMIEISVFSREIYKEILAAISQIECRIYNIDEMDDEISLEEVFRIKN